MNPKFRNINDASDEYVWESLPLVGSPPVSAGRARIHFEKESRAPSKRLVGLTPDGWKYVHQNLVFDVSEDGLIAFTHFWLLAVFWLYPDSALAARYKVQWVDPDFLPIEMPGGRYRVEMNLMEVV